MTSLRKYPPFSQIKHPVPDFNRLAGDCTISHPLFKRPPNFYDDRKGGTPLTSLLSFHLLKIRFAYLVVKGICHWHRSVFFLTFANGGQGTGRDLCSLAFRLPGADARCAHPFAGPLHHRGGLCHCPGWSQHEGLVLSKGNKQETQLRGVPFFFWRKGELGKSTSRCLREVTYDTSPLAACLCFLQVWLFYLPGAKSP